jgi:hypothetical protein
MITAMLIVLAACFFIGILAWLAWDDRDYACKVAAAKERAKAAGPPEEHLLALILAFSDIGGCMDAAELELMQREVKQIYGRRAWQAK